MESTLFKEAASSQKHVTQPKQLTSKLNKIVGWILDIIGTIVIIGWAIWVLNVESEQSFFACLPEYLVVAVIGIFLIIIGLRLADGGSIYRRGDEDTA